MGVVATRPLSKVRMASPRAPFYNFCKSKYSIILKHRVPSMYTFLMLNKLQNSLFGIQNFVLSKKSGGPTKGQRKCLGDIAPLSHCGVATARRSHSILVSMA